MLLQTSADVFQRAALTYLTFSLYFSFYIFLPLLYCLQLFVTEILFRICEESS